MTLVCYLACLLLGPQEAMSMELFQKLLASMWAMGLPRDHANTAMRSKALTTGWSPGWVGRRGQRTAPELLYG